MVSQAAYYSTSASDGGRRYNPHRPSYPPYLEFPGHERRFHPSPSHDAHARPATMTDQQMDIDSAPQRKRIAVACGRCRKRKIRCSGDVGTGEACLNCKNAGTDQCLFLRVQSREAPLLGEPSDFHVGYTRGTASPGPPPHGMGSYASSDGSMTVTSISYPDSPAPAKSYYPGASYSPHYPDEFDHYSAGQPMLHDSVTGMMPNQWARKPYTSTMYMEPVSYATTGYGSSAPLVHRPAPSAEPPSSLSLSGFGADLPSTTTPQPGDRLLPNPATRTPYPSIKSPAPHHTPTGATLADIASAASYVSSFETSGSGGSGMSYGTTSSSSHRSSSSSGAAHEPDGLFSEHERSSIQSQGPGLDFGGYTTADPLSSSGSRRDSSGGGGGTLANGHTYVPSESMYAPAPHPQYGYGAHHHHRAGAVGSSRGADGHRMASVASRR